MVGRLDDIPADIATRARQVLAELPEGVPRTPTQGRWLGPGQDTTMLKSGTGDQWYQAARAKALTFDEDDRRALAVTRHVEVKMAMRLHPGQHETIVIDRAICGRASADQSRPASCDRYLHKFLAPGAMLTVVDHDGNAITYRGETR